MPRAGKRKAALMLRAFPNLEKSFIAKYVYQNVAIKSKGKAGQRKPRLSLTVKIFVGLAIILFVLLIAGTNTQTARFFSAIGQPLGGPPPVPGVTVINVGGCQNLTVSGANYRLAADINESTR